MVEDDSGHSLDLKDAGLSCGRGRGGIERLARDC